MQPRHAGSIASTMASITTLRRNTISNEPMWRCSSRTATAMAVNESTAPPIHSTPRTEFETGRSGHFPYVMVFALRDGPVS